MVKFISWIKSNKFIFILIIISILSHRVWFDFDSVLTFSDWFYWNNTSVKELFSSWGTWIYQWNGLGTPNIQIYFNVFYLFWSILANLGISYDAASKLNIFIPISIFGFLTPYFYISYKIKDKFIAFICALFYGTTTYFLILQTAHLPIALVYSMAPLVIHAFEISINKNRLFNWVIFSLIFSVAAFHEIRIAYILSIILFINLIFLHSYSIKKYLKNIFICGLIIVGLNMFWILPTILGGIYSEVGAIAGRGLFGNFLSNINYAFNIYHWSWTGGYPDQDFNPQHIKFYFWILPIFIFSSFLLLKKQNIVKEILFFLIVLLLGIFIVKQSAAPFNFSYEFLYENFPGFMLFRESSKFYLMVSIGYLGLLSYSLLTIKNKLYSAKRKLYYLISFILVLIFMINLIPLFNQDLKTLFVNRSIPDDYKKFNEIRNANYEFQRILFVPTYSKWVDTSASDRRVAMIGLLDSNWRFNLDLIEEPYKYTEAEQMIKLLSFKHANNLLDYSSIKYVVVPIKDTKNDDDLFKFYGKNRDYYIENLNKLDYLKKIKFGQANLVIYENQNSTPHIYLTKEDIDINKDIKFEEIDYHSKNPTEYKINIKNIKEPRYLIFSESYHPKWKIRVGDFKFYQSFTKNYFLTYKNHIKNNANLNSFYLDPAEICKNYDCFKNKDGSYNINLTLYFSSQNYFYWGLIVSFVVLFSAVIYILAMIIKRK